MHLYTKVNSVIATHILDKFITATTFLNTRDFCKLFLQKGTEGVTSPCLFPVLKIFSQKF